MKSRILTWRSASCFVTRASLSSHHNERTFDVKADGVTVDGRVERAGGWRLLDFHLPRNQEAATHGARQEAKQAIARRSGVRPRAVADGVPADREPRPDVHPA